ncbi:MAG TPA: ABC transporter permease [Thermoleophilaceae bacterium]|jgi:putative spermidine/putrescine transport system permease protein|nr:ABC transporter permease [Thermoleophilaceae bacterium]
MDARESLRDALGGYRLALVALGALLALFLLVPLAVILPQAFSSGLFFKFPPPGYSTTWFQQIFNDPLWRGAFSRSLWTATVGATLATTCGTLAAIGLRRLGAGARVLRTLFLAPLVMPQLVLAIGIYVARDDLGLGSSLWTLILGQAALAFPVVVVVASAGLSAVDPALSRASASLGHAWPSTVWRVELPLIRRSVLSAFVLAFALCFDEAVLAYFLSPPGRPTLPTQLWLASTENASPAIAAVSACIVGFALVLLVVAGILGRQAATAKPRSAT